MADRVAGIEAYSPEAREAVLRVCRHVIGKLRGHTDDLVVVGGLVPSLLIDPANASAAHPGTLDLDLGMSVAVVEEKRYDAIEARLREGRFVPDVNQSGRDTRQRWRLDAGEDSDVTIDFLIAELEAGATAPDVQSLTGRLGAIPNRLLPLAFLDRELVPIPGPTALGAQADERVWVCGPGAFVLLKAFAFESRSAERDAFDLVYVLQNYPEGVSAVAGRMRPLLDDSRARGVLDVLGQRFGEIDAVGPVAVAHFLYGRPDDDAQRDAEAIVQELLRRL